MHWYQMEGLYRWTELQNARIEGEGLAYQRLAYSSSSKHLATCRRVNNSSLINKHVVTLMPRDPSSTPARKQSRSHISQVSICSCIRSGYKSKRPLPWTRLLIDNLPCRGAPRFPTRLIALAGHTFLGHARPRKINTSHPDLGSTERSLPVYILSTPGSGPIARCTPDRCA